MIGLDTAVAVETGLPPRPCPPSPAGLACRLEPQLLSLLWGEEHQVLTEGCKHGGALEGPGPGQAAQLQDKPNSEQDVRVVHFLD